MKKKGIQIVKTVAAATLGVVAAGYLAGAVYYGNHLMKGTVINGMAVSNKSANQVKKAIAEYELVVCERTADGSRIEVKITGEEVGLELTDKKAVQDIIKEQGVFSWVLSGERTYEVENLVTLDEEKLSDIVNSLEGFKEDSVQKPKDAYISDYVSGKGYELIPEKEGNQLRQDVTLEAIRRAVLTMDEKIDLTKSGCYEVPSVTVKDQKLKELYERLSTYTSAEITYSFDENTEVVNGDLINQWLKIKNNEVTIVKEKVEEFIAGLRSKYDTIFTDRTFKTSYGEEVHISGGDYGWWMNTPKEVEKILQLIKKGKQTNRTPEYYQKAASYGENDYGDSYVEINLTAQHLFVYKKGKKVLESDFVSGNVSAGNGTPEGVYSLTYKEEMAELVGETYSTPVSYWMPFNGNIGMHDATWRSQFGGKLYATGGSHGCINLPYAMAKKIYGYIEKGSPVICYKLPGTESSKTTGQTNEEIAESVIESIDKIGKVTSASRKRIEHSRAIYNELSYSQRKLVTNYDKLVAAEAKLRG